MLCDLLFISPHDVKAIKERCDNSAFVVRMVFEMVIHDVF